MRLVAMLTVLVMVSAACGNSKKGDATAPTRPVGPTQTTASLSDLKKNVHITAKGVTDSTITVDTIASKTNPLHGKYAEIADGMQAYFNMVNADGGIYGRKLQIGKQRDDLAGLTNRPEVQQALATDNAFATFIATLQFGGADLLQAAGQPTFGWNINAEYGDKNALFGNESALCNSADCIGMFGSWLAKKVGITKVGVLAYGVNKSSIDCGKGTVNSFNYYGVAQVVFHDFSLAFGEPDLTAQVAQMKKAGVQMVFTCTDKDETLVLAKEMKKQGLNAIQELPNGYDQGFIAANKQYYEGSYVVPQFTALEWKPQLPEMKVFEKWMAAEHKQVYEISVVGWIAAYQFVLGLKLAGPEFSQQKVIDGLNTQTDVTVGGMIPRIDWTKAHIDPVKHPDTHDPIACFNVLVIKNGVFTPTFATADKPYLCVDQTPGKKDVPLNPPTRNFVRG